MLVNAYRKKSATFRKSVGLLNSRGLTRGNRGHKPSKLSKMMMAKTYWSILLWSLLCSTAVAQNMNGRHGGGMAPKGFLENKGQLYDQNNQANNEVLFVYRSGGARVQLRQQGYSIELLSRQKEEVFSESTGKTEAEHSYQFHRIDVQFANANKQSIIRKGKVLPGYSNYYLHHTPEEGITKVKSYRQITYKNIYPNIDIVFMLHQENGPADSLLTLGVKYNIVVKPGGRLQDVQLVYEGMKGLSVNDATLDLSTSLGGIQESIPMSYTSGKGGRQEIQVAYQQGDHGIGFHTDARVNGDDTLVVDPVFYNTRKIGTYYGDDNEDRSFDVAIDSKDNIYICGRSNSSLLPITTTTHQGTIGGAQDAFVAKFDPELEKLLWSTFYGGKEEDEAHSLALDPSGNIYLTGYTESSGAISTTSCHQPSIGSSTASDAFLAKFNSSGVRQWGTYYGGADEDKSWAVAVDDSFVVISGETISSNGTGTSKIIATTHQTSLAGSTENDAFIAKFDLSGIRQWGTYYGGDEKDGSLGIVLDNSDNLYAIGITNSDTGITTLSSNSRSSEEVFIVKFDRKGKRQWGRYFGGKNADRGNDIYFSSNALFITGSTASSNGISNTTKKFGNTDAFLAKLKTSDGSTIWGQYYGGKSIDVGTGVTVDDNGNILITGNTDSDDIASKRSFQSSRGTGSVDAFLAKFNSGGNEIWSTYYGDQKDDEGTSVVTDSKGFMVFTGVTRSTSVIATKGAYEENHQKTDDAFIAKFCDIIITQQPQDQKVWIGNSASFSVKHIGTKDGAWKYQWYKNDTAIAGETGLTINITNADSNDAGLYKLKISNDCGVLFTDSAKLTVCSYTPPKRICKGESTTVTFAREKGASYKWTPNYRLNIDTGVQVILSPFKTTDYTVTISKGTASSTVKFTVTVKDIPPADAGADITLCSGQTGQLGSSGCTGCSYKWTPVTGLSSTTISNPTVSHTITGTSSQTFTYTLTTTKQGCDSTDQVKVTVHPLPRVNAGKDKTVCLNSGKLTLSGSPSGGTWSGKGIPTASNSTFAPRLAGIGQHTLVYVFTDATTKCTDSDQVVITVDSLPHVNAGRDTFFCNTATSARLSGFSPSGGTWSGHTNLTSAGAFNPKSAGNGQYTVYYTYEDPTTKCDSTDEIVIKVGNLTPAKAGNDTSVCLNEPSFTLQAWSPSGGGWSGTGVSAGVFSPKSAGVGKHKITYTVGSGTCLSTDERYITVNALPSISLRSVSQKCINDADFKLNPSSVGTWSGTGVSAYNFSPSTAGAGRHKLIYAEKNSSGCEASDSIFIRVNDTPSVKAFDTTVCDIAGEIQLRSDSLGGDWTGSTYVKTNGKFDASKAGVGKYTVSYTYKSSYTQCQSTEAAVVEVIAPTNVDAGVNDTFCINHAAITLKGSPNGGTWSGNGVSGNTFTPANAQKGRNELIYSVGSGTCLNRDTVYMQVYDLPTVNAGSDLSKCLNDAEFNLSTASGGTWSGTGVSTNKFDPAVAKTGNHFPKYTITDANGCTDYDSIKITVNDTPSVTAFDTTVCYIAGEIQLRANKSGGDWAGSTHIKTNGKFNAGKAGVGKYTVSYTYKSSSTQCQSIVTALVEVIAPKSINAGANDTFCINDPAIALSGMPGGGTWTGNGMKDSIFTPSNAQKGQNEIIYNIGSGTCLNRDTLYLHVNDLPVVRAGSDVGLCDGDDTLTINTGYPSGGSWKGKGIQNAKRGLFSPIVADTGKHLLEYAYTDGNGCKNADTLEVTVHPLPKITIRDTTVCNIAGKIQLFSKPTTGSWSGHKELAPNGQFDVVKADTAVHKVYYTLKDATTQCSNIDSITVTVINPQRARAGLNDTFCINDKDTILVGKPSGGTWTGTGLSSNTFSPSTAKDGEHSLYYTFGTGSCRNTDTVVMKVNDLPSVDAGTNLQACISDDSLSITQQSPKGGYWTGNVFIDSLNSIYSPSQAGIDTHKVFYHLIDTNGCYNADSTHIIVNPLPALKVPALLQLCNQPLPITLTGRPGGGTWKGTGISSDSIYTPSKVDTHEVYYVFTDNKGCKNRDTTVIEVINPEQVIVGPKLQVCHLSDSLVLTASPSGGTWIAAPNFNSKGVFHPLDTGMHRLVYTKGSSTCQTFDTLDVRVIPLPVISGIARQSACEDADTLLLDTAAYKPLGGIWTGPTVVDTVLGRILPSKTGGDSTSTLIYRYTDTATTCANSDTSTIRVHRLPVVSASDTSICNQPIASRFFGSPLGGTWSQNGILSNGTFTPSDTGTFPVIYTYTDSNTCTSYDTMTITVNDPKYALAGNSFEICINDEIQLKGNDTTGWWTGNDVTRSGYFTPKKVTTYILTFSLGTGTCLTQDSLKAKVNPLPTVTLAGPTKLCTNDAAHSFISNASPKGGWFQNPNISDTINGVFDPSTASLGSHIIYYHYIDPKGCYQLDSHTLVVNGLPKLSFNLDTVLCVNTSITFPNSSASTNNYRWNFGDGSGWKTVFSPTHTYIDTGYFPMQVIGTTPDGCSDTFSQRFYVVAPPQARFEISPKKGCGPLYVSFQDRSIGRFTTYRWGFETGDTLTKKDLQVFPFPSYVYDSIIYTLELRVTNVCKSVFWYDSVTVYPTPTANVKIEPKIGCTPLPVTFRNRSYGMPGNFLYRFGDGSTSSRLDTIFQHSYFTDTTRSVYQFVFTTENICGADTQLTDIIVKPNRLSAFFELDTNQGCTPFVLRAEDHHVGDATVAWLVSDGTAYGNQDTVRHVLDKPGSYTLMQMLDNGCAKDTFVSTVVVHQSPEASFSIDSTSTCQNIDVHFENTSPNVSAHRWDFGDGKTSEVAAPSHRFPSADTFRVTLTVVGANEFQCEASITKPVFILPLPQIVVSPADTSGCREFSSQHLSRSSNARFFEWLINDGSSARYSGDSIWHTYQDSGVFKNQLIAESSEGCIDTGTFITRVLPRPEAAFSTDSSIFCGAPKTINFQNNTRFGSVFRWQYGDGATSNGRKGAHSYTDYGTYQVRLYAENRYQCSDSFSMPIELLRKPIIDITASEDGCEPLPVQFSNNTRFADSFYWQLSDGRNSNDTSPTFILHYADQPYTIKLLASAKATCFDSIEFNTPVEIWPKPLSSFTYQEIILPKQHGNFIFNSTSPPMADYRWDYGDGGKGRGAIDTHRFAYRDSFWVQHFVTNEFGCLDTSGQWIQVDMYGLFVPNTMLLDGSGKGYTLFTPRGVGLESYTAEVFTTWGELVWTSSSLNANRPDESWDGRHHIKGTLLDEDAYVWRIQATFLNGEKWQGMPDGNGGFKTFGTITVVR